MIVIQTEFVFISSIVVYNFMQILVDSETSTIWEFVVFGGLTNQRICGFSQFVKFHCGSHNQVALSIRIVSLGDFEVGESLMRKFDSEENSAIIRIIFRRTDDIARNLMICGIEN